MTEEKRTFFEKLSRIQSNLKVPKSNTNKFGGYQYRSCEDILQGIKPLLNGLALTVSDDIVMVGDRVYIKATASITDGEHSLSVNGWAREAQTKKGMDDSQITGSTSSYARKYALCGLFAIDDTKDADQMPPEAPTPPKKQIEKKEKPNLNKRVHDLCSGMSPDEKKKILKDLTYRSQEKDGKKMEAYIADPVTLKTNLGTFPRPETLERIIKELEALN